MWPVTFVVLCLIMCIPIITWCIEEYRYQKEIKKEYEKPLGYQKKSLDDLHDARATRDDDDLE